MLTITGIFPAWINAEEAWAEIESAGFEGTETRLFAESQDEEEYDLLGPIRLSDSALNALQGSLYPHSPAKGGSVIAEVVTEDFYASEIISILESHGAIEMDLRRL